MNAKFYGNNIIKFITAIITSLMTGILKFYKIYDIQVQYSTACYNSIQQIMGICRARSCDKFNLQVRINLTFHKHDIAKK